MNKFSKIHRFNSAHIINTTLKTQLWWLVKFVVVDAVIPVIQVARIRHLLLCQIFFFELRLTVLKINTDNTDRNQNNELP